MASSLMVVVTSKGSDQTALMQSDLSLCKSPMPLCCKSHDVAHFLTYAKFTRKKKKKKREKKKREKKKN